jgi:hypothetical protein
VVLHEKHDTAAVFPTGEQEQMIGAKVEHVRKPQWPPQNRPMMVTSKPANENVYSWTIGFGTYNASDRNLSVDCLLPENVFPLAFLRFLPNGSFLSKNFALG